MLDEQVEKILSKVKKYLDKYGVIHHFLENRIFSHIDLKEEIKRIILTNETSKSEKTDDASLIGGRIHVDDCLEHCLGDEVSDRAIEDLFNLMSFYGISQSRLIDTVINYQKLMNTEEELIISVDGECAGLALTYIAAELYKNLYGVNLMQLLPQLHQFEHTLANIAYWDGVTIDEKLRNDMDFFINTVHELQDNQREPSFLLNGIHTNLSFSWVFNQATLTHFINLFSQNHPQLIYMGADHHASMIYPQSANKIVYFNPNQRFGSMKLSVDDSFFSLLCGGLRTGHSNTYEDRMPISLKVFSAVEHKMELKKIIDELIDVAINSEPDLQSMDRRLAIGRVINKQGSNGRTALMEAVNENNIELVKLLLNEYGADPGLNDIYGKNAILSAILKNDEASALEILNHMEMYQINKVVNGSSCLHWALIKKHHELAMRLLSIEDIKLNLQSKHEYALGFTPLHFAIHAGFDDVCEALITNPDVLLNVAEKQRGITPLHAAIGWHRPQVVKLLLEQERIVKNKRSKETSEQYPDGYNALIYLANEFKNLDDSDPEYPQTVQQLSDIYQLVMHADFKLEQLVLLDQLAIFTHLIELNEHYADELLQHIRYGIILLDPDEAECMQFVSYLIAREETIFTEQDIPLLELYLEYSPDFDLDLLSNQCNKNTILSSWLSAQLEEDAPLNLDGVNKEEPVTKEVTPLVKHWLFKENKFIINGQQDDLLNIESDKQDADEFKLGS